MSLRHILVGNRRFRVRRVVGVRMVVQVLVWSVVAVAALTVYRTPGLLDSSLTVGGVLNALPFTLLPFVVLGVAVVVVLNTVLELRYLLFGRRSRWWAYDSGTYDDFDGGSCSIRSATSAVTTATVGEMASIPLASVPSRGSIDRSGTRRATGRPPPLYQ